MGRLAKRRFAAANWFREELERYGIRSRVVPSLSGVRPYLRPDLPVLIPGCAVELRLSEVGLEVPPMDLETALALWQPRALYEVKPGQPIPQHVPVLDRQRIATWAWWSKLYEVGLVADEPPVSWEEVKLEGEA